MAAQARIYALSEHSNAAFEHRTGHTATLVGEYIILFGGQIDGECTASLEALHIDTLQSQVLQPVNVECGGKTPKPRLGHAACAAVTKWS